MKDKQLNFFWIGFVIAAAAAGLVYWFYRQNQDVIIFDDAVQPPPREPELEDIYGIGPVYASRLREAGIRTFADLAETPAERIDEILGRHQPQAAQWIAEARSLAG
jgi:predicted flap endonuclease-1-like 5' DNA nuclease